ncbi:MAG: glycosyltransferase family 2 protein [Candidatus Buchananbacteria bacterium]|nr:glycosyltransferase family 2 protein [Candidatus Buchananbacteria bacterium]
MYHGKKVSIVIPTYNEAGSIAQVITDFFATGFVDEVVAVDNNALGNTAEEIAKTPARHIRETENQGYGHALMRGMREATGDLIVTVEADGTFTANDLEKFLIFSRDFDVVWGTRTSRATIWSGAFMPFSVRLGNWGVAKLLEVVYNGPTLTDVGCTYKLFSRSALEKVERLFKFSDGSGTFSPELMIWTLRSGIIPIEIPVMFLPRVGQSMYTGNITKSVILGFKMIGLIFRYRSKQL